MENGIVFIVLTLQKSYTKGLLTLLTHRETSDVKIAVLAHTARSTRATLPKQESHLAGWLN